MDAHVPLCDLDSYIQDALDLIEFANGAVDTPWGKVRADMGHPAPFNLKFIGIGNEQWGKEYPEHLERVMTITTVKARKFLPENMPVMAKERSGTISMLHCLRRPL